MVYPVPDLNRYAHRYSTFHFLLKVFTLFAFLSLAAFPARSQPCTTPIQNNSFDIKPAICFASVALLQGSLPTGGTGTYSYQWQVNVGDCSDNGFVPILGATGKDYIVLVVANDDNCYRRIVVSGNCSSASNKAKVQGQDRTNPSPPVVSTVQPTCNGGGTITVTSPAPASGISYSIDGSNYSNTSGIFSGLTPGTYGVTAKHSSGCVSPTRTVALNAPAPIAGNVSPATSAICTGQSQVLTATGGTSYRWYRNNTLITGAASNTYTATEAGTYKADVIVGTCTSSSNNAVVTETPAPSGTIAPATASICTGSSQVLTATGGTSYQWYRNNIIITGATAATYTATQAGTYSAVIFSGSCSGPASNTAIVTQANSPSGNISPATATICPGNSQVLSATGGTSYQWYRNNIIITGATAATYTATQAGTYSVVIFSGSCSGPASNTAVVTQANAPSGNISPATATICPGNSQVLSATGGTSYQWYRNNIIITGATASTYTATQAGTYSVVIFSGSCSGPASNTSVVAQANAPSGNISPATATICPGNSQVLSATGGTSYQWYRNNIIITGATAATYTATQAGTYSAVIFSGSCSGPASNTVVITQASSPNGTIVPATGSLCGSNASLVLNVNGGTSYQWYRNNITITGATASTYTATQAGTYSAVIFSGSCSGPASNTAVITQTNAPTGNISPATATICPGGSQALSVTGGTSYQWYKDNIIITGATAATYTATQAGTYSAVIINGACSGQASNIAVVTQASSPSGNISPATATICPGNSQVLSATGGTSYQWYRNNIIITGATAATYTATQTGTYSVVIFSGSCSGPASNTAVVTQTNAPSGNISPATATICSGNSQVLSATGGTSYQWYRNNIIITGATAATYTATQAGTYSVVIFSGSCSGPASNTAVVTQANAPSGNISPATATICPGNSQVLSATGGTSYQWYRNNIIITGATAATYTATQAGTYSVVIFSGSCSGPASNTAVVTQANAPSGNISPATATICPGGSQALSVTGGTSYQWMRNNVAIPGATSSTYTANQDGIYTVTITNGSCSGPASNQAVVTISSSPSGTIAPATASICVGSSQVLTATGGTSYQWYRNNVIITGATAATYTATTVGTYSAVIFSGSCSGPASNQAVVTISSSPSGTIVPATASICTGSSQVLTATGGTSYQWYRNNIIITGATAATYTATQTGTYSVVIFSGSCSGPASNTAVVTQTNAPSGNISPATATICSGNSQVLSATGGTSYQWMRNNVAIPGATSSTYSVTQDGIYTVTITNGSCSGPASNQAVVTLASSPSGTIAPATASICTGSSQVLTATGGTSYQWYRNNIIITGATVATYTATQAGTYSVDVINTQGCKAKASNDVVVTVNAAPNGSITPSSGTICTNGSLTLTVNGGTSYQWYKNGTLINGATSATYTATEIGVYTADVINSQGCKAQASNAATIIQGTAPSGAITPSVAGLCPGQIVILTVSGGITYQWYLNGNAIAGATGSTYVAGSLGTYSANIYSGSCSGPASNTSVVTPSAPITFSVSTTQPTCNQPAGNISITNVTGGTGAYSYSINNGSSFQAGNTFSNVPIGTYQAIVADASGCRSNTQTVTINQPTSVLSASVNTTHITCAQPSGAVTVMANGGTAPYQYSLNGGTFQSSNSFNNLVAGPHRVMVKDAVGCTFELNFTIQQNNSTLSATATTTNAGCGQQTGSVQITAAGGSPAYSYSLDNGAYQPNNTFNNVAVGSHNVKIKDQSGCLAEVNFQIIQAGGNPLLVINNPPPVCFGTTTSLQLPSITNGSDPALTLTYWIDSAATSPLTNPGAVTAGKYYIKATNAAGCYLIKAVTVSVSSSTAGAITVSGSTTPCRGQIVTLTASSGRSYQWYWNNTPITNAVSRTFLAGSDGIYSVIIDDGSCRAFASNQIQLTYKDCPILLEPKVFVPTAFSPNENNANDVLRPILYNMRELRYFRVYNRWGQLIFETKEIGKGWNGVLNGRRQPSDTFSWMLECIDFNGNSIKESGRSVLIR